MRFQTPAAHRARAYLQRVVEQARARGEERLPSTAALADAAGVSVVTMHRAVAALRRSGTIVTGPGRAGIRLRPAPEALPDDSPPVRFPRGKAERVRRRLMADLSSGHLPPDTPLPPVKTLAPRYGLCRQTMGRVLRELATDGYIELDPAGYRPPSPRRSRLGTTLVLVAPAFGASLFEPTVRTVDHLRQLDRACARHGLRLRIVSYVDIINRPPSAILAGARERTEVLGFAVWTVGMSSRERAHRTVRRLGRTGKPVAVLDENGAMGEAPVRSGDTNRLVLRMAMEPHAGREVGRYLLRLGHRRVAFFGPECPRLRGLASEFDAAGYPDGVKRYTSDELLDAVDDRLVNRAQRVVEQTLREYLPDGDADGPALEELRDLRRRLRMVLDETRVRARYRAAFEEAYGAAGHTAWVGYNDTVALAALSFLRSKRCPVPARISVIGFDNSVGAVFRGLTSYDFGGMAAAQRMVAFVVGDGTTPAATRARCQAVSETCPGQVVERNSSAPSCR